MLLKQYDVSHGLPSGNINLVSPCTFHSQPPDKTIKKQYGIPKRLKEFTQPLIQILLKEALGRSNDPSYHHPIRSDIVI
jgi:hypothetical protein